MSSEPENAKKPDARCQDNAEPLSTCYEVAKKAGFLGCDEGGPADLSTNPEHMQGFGSK